MARNKIDRSHIELSFEDYEKANNWYSSQIEWHSKRDGKWHKSQVRYYRNMRYRISNTSYIVQSTLHKFMPQLIDNVTASNALLKRLKGV